MLLITGASGRIGRRTADLVAGSGHPLRLMTRNPAKAPSLPQTEVVEGDFSKPETLAPAFNGIDHALIISGKAKPGERALSHKNAFEAAATAGVKHIIYLSLQGAAADSKYPYSRDHFQSEQYLAASGVPFTVLRNAFYIDMLLERVDEHGVIRGPSDETPAAWVSREDVSRTAAVALASPPGGILEVTGPEAMTVREATHRLSRIAGRELSYEAESTDAARRRLQLTEKQAWRVDLTVGWFMAIAAGELDRVSDTIQKYTGEPPLSMEDYFALFPERIESLRESREERGSV